jgi:hypothetical protein
MNLRQSDPESPDPEQGKGRIKEKEGVKERTKEGKGKKEQKTKEQGCFNKTRERRLYNSWRRQRQEVAVREGKAGQTERTRGKCGHRQGQIKHSGDLSKGKEPMERLGSGQGDVVISSEQRSMDCPQL